MDNRHQQFRAYVPTEPRSCYHFLHTNLHPDMKSHQDSNLLYICESMPTITIQKCESLPLWLNGVTYVRDIGPMGS